MKLEWTEWRYAVKPQFTAPQFTVYPDLPHFQTLPNRQKRNFSTTPVNEHMIFCELNYQIELLTSGKLAILIRFSMCPILEIIKVTSTEWVQFWHDEKPHHHNHWNPNLPLTPIYCNFFRSPKCAVNWGFSVRSWVTNRFVVRNSSSIKDIKGPWATVEVKFKIEKIC